MTSAEEDHDPSRTLSPAENTHDDERLSSRPAGDLCIYFALANRSSTSLMYASMASA